MPSPATAHEIALEPGIPYLAEYVIERLLDRGEDWALYFARHATRTTERFRIRVVRSETALHPDGVDLRLARAARLVRIDHPGIVPYVTSALDPDRDVVAVVSRYLLGVTLRERLERGGKKLMRPEIARIVCEIGDALDCLHELSPTIVHGRLDASRVLLAAPDAGVRILGLEEAIDEGDRPARDQFALASIAFECLTGRAPFGADTSIATEPFPRLERIDAVPGPTADLEWVLHRAWATDESRRFATAGRLAAEIARLLGAPDAFAAARARRIERANARNAQTGSGTQRAVRPPTLPSLRTTSPETRPATPAASAPHTPQSGERPAILPNAGRYAIHNERTRTQRITTNVTAIGTTPKAAPPLPRSIGVEGRAAPTVRTPTLVGAPVAPAPAAALVPTSESRAPEAPKSAVPAPVAAPPRRIEVVPAPVAEEISIECEVDASDLLDEVVAAPIVAPTVPASIAAPPAPIVAPPPPAPIAAASNAPATRSEPPAAAFMNAILDARAASAPARAKPVVDANPFPSIPPRAMPIPLVSRPRETNESARGEERRPRGRRFMQLFGAITLALVFGGAERIAPHVPAARRWLAQWITPPHAIQHTHVPVLASPSATPEVAPVPQPPLAVAPAVAVTPTDAVPPASERGRATAAWRSVIDECAARVGRDHRHARFSVTYEGVTGNVIDVAFADPAFAARRIGVCIAEGARSVHVEPFTDRQWTGSYSIMVP